jgi:hypothetical protein
MNNINSFLKFGEIANLFEHEEIKFIIEEVRPYNLGIGK